MKMQASPTYCSSNYFFFSQFDFILQGERAFHEAREEEVIDCVKNKLLKLINLIEFL